VLHYALNDHLITSQHHAAMVVNRYTKAETTILQECVQYWFGPLDPSEDHQVEKSPKREEGLGGGSAENFCSWPDPVPWVEPGLAHFPIPIP